MPALSGLLIGSKFILVRALIHRAGKKKASQTGETHKGHKNRMQ